MTTLRNALLAALKSLMKGKSFLQALLAFWISPSSLQGARGAGRDPGQESLPGTDGSGHGSSTSHTTPPTTPSSISKKFFTTVTVTPSSTPHPSFDDFVQEAEQQLLDPVQGDRLRLFARQLKDQFRNGLLTNPACMLPSYNHQLPNGRECGRYLSLDVGGSTLRVALIELNGRKEQQSGMNILNMESFKITPQIKQLEGMDFFDWMAARIIETVSKVEETKVGNHQNFPLPMGLAWSFPIEQTSLRGGMLQSMGKGFLAADSLLGQDLGDIIETACLTRGLHVELAAIVNDSAAALLSESYAHPATRFGLILGTGVNIAVHLPVPTVGRSKFGSRPGDWFNQASHVIINTELGMFGHGILPVTRWDALLKAGHPKPEFQPLEHMVSGYYLGEVCRFVLLEAIETAGLFGGVVPPSLLVPYALDTETLSMIEGDESATLKTAIEVFQKHHPSSMPPTTADMMAVRSLASLISQRSAAIVAASVYALWSLKAETEKEFLLEFETANGSAKKVQEHADNARAELSIVQERTVVAFNGSVIERYPHYLERCQAAIDSLVATASSSSPTASNGCSNGSANGKPQQAPKGTVDLVPAKESSLLGAAVALACLGA